MESNCPKCDGKVKLTGGEHHALSQGPEKAPEPNKQTGLCEDCDTVLERIVDGTWQERR